jgi:hypothetical protein
MSLDTDFLNDLMDRIVALEKEAVTTSDAVPYWPYQQASFPYWTNRLGPYEQVFAYGEDVPRDESSVLMRLVAAHVSEGYEGESQSNIHQWVVATLNKFEDNPYLVSTTYATEFDDIAPDGAVIISHTGLVIFQNAGVLANQLGVEFTLSVPALRQAY